MPATWKTVRVFISSTFHDMQAERDHLVRFVFPKLRQELLQRRIHLVDMDLRWGVTSEQDALSVCREVVDECRPRFLCMLGGRYGWVPPDKTRSITADEVYYGVLDRDLTSRGFAFFYFRDPSATAAMIEVLPGEFRELPDSHGAVALAELKTAITGAGLQPFIYRAQWDDPSRRLIGLKEFGDRVYADLKQSIAQEFGPTTGEKPDEFTEENAAMEAFIEERVQRFVLGSRQPVWNELRHHAESTGGNGYLCLTGAAGSGKSALLGKFCQDYREAHPQDLVIPHFVGASPGSTDVRRTLRRLCRELMTGAGLTAEIPEDPEKLRVAFAEILKKSSARKRVVILLDAINQFDPTTQLAGWSWLPEELPATARIILSTLDGPALDTLRQRRQPPRSVELQPLDAPDREAIIREFLHRYRKSMTDAQRAALLAKADAGTPLYLLVALEELRTLGTYEEITDRIAQLPPDTRALFIWILKRLEDDDGFRDASGRKIGRELVSRFVSLLGASRHGLSQQELVELLSPGDPQGNVAALAQLLRPYLMQRGELLDFYHGQFREAAEQNYLAEQDERLHAHQVLANLFRQKADPTGDRTWTGGLRALTELPYHETRGAIWDFENSLCDLQLLENRAAMGPYALVANLHQALTELPSYHQFAAVLDLLGRSIGENAEFLVSHPSTLFQCVWNSCWSSGSENPSDHWRHESDNSHSVIPQDERVRIAISTLLERWLKEKEARDMEFTWVRLIWPPSLSRVSPIAHLWREVVNLTAVAVSANGLYFATGCADGKIAIWDTARSDRLLSLQMQNGEIRVIVFSPDGASIVVGTGDGTLSVWDATSGSKRCVLMKCDLFEETDSIFFPTPSVMVSFGKTRQAHIWDVASWSHLVTIENFSWDALPFVERKNPWQLRIQGGSAGPETAVVSAATGKTVAWFPHPLKNALSDRLGRIWAGRVGAGRGPIIVGIEGAPKQQEEACSTVRCVSAWCKPVSWWVKMQQRENGTDSAFCCPNCQEWSTIPKSALGTELPCPKCGKPSRINPLTMNADWRLIAKAWKGE